MDERPSLAHLLAEAVACGMMPEYADKLLAACEAEQQRSAGASPLGVSPASQALVEPLSERELEVLQLVAQGLSNREIGERLFLALGTVKGHSGIAALHEAAAYLAGLAFFVLVMDDTSIPLDQDVVGRMARDQHNVAGQPPTGVELHILIARTNSVPICLERTGGVP